MSETATQSRSLFWRILPPALVFVAGIVLLEFSVRAFHVRQFLVPPPTKVWRAFIDSAPEMWTGLLETIEAAGIGFVLSALAGPTIAILLSSTRWTERAFYPYAIFFQTIPIVGIAPLLVIWLGYGLPAVVASAFIVSVFPMVASTVAGLRSTDPALLDLFKLYGAGAFATLFRLRLPSSIPQTLTGMRITAGLAVIGAIVGQFIAGGGLGAVIDSARTQQRTDKVFAAVILVCLLGLAMLAIVNLASMILLRHWHPSARDIE